VLVRAHLMGAIIRVIIVIGDTSAIIRVIIIIVVGGMGLQH
jgi:hypothetical protein